MAAWRGRSDSLAAAQPSLYDSFQHRSWVWKYSQIFITTIFRHVSSKSNVFQNLMIIFHNKLSDVGTTAWKCTQKLSSKRSILFHCRNWNWNKTSLKNLRVKIEIIGPKNCFPLCRGLHEVLQKWALLQRDHVKWSCDWSGWIKILKREATRRVKEQRYILIG